MDGNPLCSLSWELPAACSSQDSKEDQRPGAEEGDAAPSGLVPSLKVKAREGSEHKVFIIAYNCLYTYASIGFMIWLDQAYRCIF